MTPVRYLNRRHWRTLLAVLAVVFASVLAVLVPAAAATDSLGATALFEGKTIQLADGWGEATACLVRSDAEVVECFRTEEELDVRIVQLEQSRGPEAPRRLSSWCSGYLQLYDGTAYSGSVLYVRDRYHWINLGNYGFSNRTSSFKISACPAIFADGDYGAGDWYPTSQTEAWDQSPSMAPGWDNRVSSIYVG